MKRVALARLIIKPCKIIFADEPTGKGNVKHFDAIKQMVMLRAYLIHTPAQDCRKEGIVSASL